MVRLMDAREVAEGTPSGETLEKPDPVEKAIIARMQWGELGDAMKRNYAASTARSPFRRFLFAGPRPENAWRTYMAKAVDGPVNPEKREVSDEAAMAAEIKEMARFVGADLVGISKLDQAFVYPYRFADPYRGLDTERIPIELHHSYAISTGVEMDLQKIRSTPSYIDNAEVGRTYAAIARAACDLAAYIRELGYPARAHHTANEMVCHVPIAARGGLGELGRNGILVSSRFGPRLRLATVTTDLPMAADRPVNLGVRAFCEMCKKCATNCPGRAIQQGPRAVYKGADKWKIDQVACIRFWTANPDKWSSCDTCIKDCPWSKPDVWYHHLSTRAAARSAIARKLLLWADDLIYGKHPYYRVGWLGYTSYRVGPRK